MDKAHVLNSLLLEVLIPGLAFAVVLALEGCLGVQRADSSIEIAGLAVEERLIGLSIVESRLRHCVVAAVDGDGGLAALDDAGVIDHQGDGYHDKYGGDDTVEDVGLLFSSTLLSLTGGLGVNRAAG